MTDRPAWMDPNKSPKAPTTSGARKQPQSYITSSVPPAVSQQVVTMKLPSVVTVGVAIIATLMMLNVYFWAAIWLFGRMNPPAGDAFGLIFASDYLSTMRVILALVFAGIASAFTWTIGDTIAR